MPPRRPSQELVQIDIEKRTDLHPVGADVEQ
jgi:hypothetical protein